MKKVGQVENDICNIEKFRVKITPSPSSTFGREVLIPEYVGESSCSNLTVKEWKNMFLKYYYGLNLSVDVLKDMSPPDIAASDDMALSDVRNTWNFILLSEHGRS